MNLLFIPLIAAVILLSPIPKGTDQPRECTVIGVLDGDSLRVRCPGEAPFQVRIYGVDAPERGMPFAARARQWMSRQAFGKQARIFPMETDRYGRMVARVRVDGDDLSLAIIGAGLAWHYRRYAPDESELAEAERVARKARRGLWSDPKPVPPWEHREFARRSTPK